MNNFVGMLITVRTGQTISSLGKVSNEILPGKHHFTVLLFWAELQMELLAPHVIYYYTGREAVPD